MCGSVCWVLLQGRGAGVGGIGEEPPRGAPARPAVEGARLVRGACLVSLSGTRPAPRTPVHTFLSGQSLRVRFIPLRALLH